MAERIRIEVAYALPDRQSLLRLELAVGATAIEAVRLGELSIGDGLPEPLELAIHGRPCQHRTVLADGDRVEVLRPLVFDPKESRRRRAAHAARQAQSAADSAGSSPARKALPGS